MRKAIEKTEKGYVLKTLLNDQVILEEELSSKRIIVVNDEYLDVISALVIYGNEPKKQLYRDNEDYEIKDNIIYMNGRLEGYLMGAIKIDSIHPHVIGIATIEKHNETVRFLEEMDIKRLTA